MQQQSTYTRSITATQETIRPSAPRWAPTKPWAAACGIARILVLGLGLSLGFSLAAPAADAADSPVDATNESLTAGLRGGGGGGKCNIPTDGTPSPSFGAEKFTQMMLRFEEFGTQNLAQPENTDSLAGSCCPSRSSVRGESNAEPCVDCPLGLPPPYGPDGVTFSAYGKPKSADLDALLAQRLHPYPQKNCEDEGPGQSPRNPWEECIEQTHTGTLTPIKPGGLPSFCDGRAAGPQYGHQRWEEFFPSVWTQTAQAGARTNRGMRDDRQTHAYALGEFGPDGLYHNTVHGISAAACAGKDEIACKAVVNQDTNAGDRLCTWDGNSQQCSGKFDATTEGVEVKFHPNMPVQDHQALWAFDGTFPPKLLMARYNEGVLFRHHNALPIKFEANRGFKNHFITTHRHNGHQGAESDGYAQSFFLPGQLYDYAWPMLLAGHDPGGHVNNPLATEPRAGTPCDPGDPGDPDKKPEKLVISYPSPLMDPNGKECTRAQKLDENPPRPNFAPGSPTYAINDDPNTRYENPAACGWRRVEVTCPAEGLIKIPGDWRETMSTHWFHDHMLDYTAQNVYGGNAAMFNMYSAVDSGNECISDGVSLKFPSGCEQRWGNRDYDINLLLSGKAWGQDTQSYQGTTAPGNPYGEDPDPENIQGQLWFATFNTDGFLGDKMMVNWLNDPYLDVRARRYRFRILNGHVSRYLRNSLVVQRNHGDGDPKGEIPGEDGNTSYDLVPFYMIANDGNVLEHAVAFDGTMDLDADGDKLDHFGLMPTHAIAERYDIVVDFSAENPANIKVDDKLYMVNQLEHRNGKRPHVAIPIAEILSGDYERDGNCDPIIGKFLELRVHAYAGTDPSMDPSRYVSGNNNGDDGEPLTMIPLPSITEQELADAHHRTFIFGRGAASDNEPVTITKAPLTDMSPAPSAVGEDFEFTVAPEESTNHIEIDQLPFHPDLPWGIKTDDGSTGMLTMDPHRLSAAPKLGDLEIWHLKNGGNGWSHPVHVHFEEGRILKRGGEAPPEWEKWARKDVYRVGRMDDSTASVTFAIRFREFGGTYMEHCHNTQHEDHAMLLRWDIENPGQLKPYITPEPSWNGCAYTESYEIPTASQRSSVVGDPKAKEDTFKRWSAADLLGPGGKADIVAAPDEDPPVAPAPDEDPHIAAEPHDDADSDSDSDDGTDSVTASLGSTPKPPETEAETPVSSNRKKRAEDNARQRTSQNAWIARTSRAPAKSVETHRVWRRSASKEGRMPKQAMKDRAEQNLRQKMLRHSGIAKRKAKAQRAKNKTLKISRFWK